LARLYTTAQGCAGLVAMAASRMVVVESAGIVNVPVLRSGSTDRQVLVNYETGSSTRLAPEAQTGVVTFAPGQSSNTLALQLVDNAQIEPNEAVPVRLTGSSSGAVFGQSLGTLLTIVDDESADSPGNIDVSYRPVFNGAVFALAVQPDDKTIVGELVSLRNGTSGSHVKRLNSDGSLDSSFHTSVAGNGEHALITTLTLQSDGKILVGGTFTNIDGVVRIGIARLNLDGSVDGSFDPDLGPRAAGASWIPPLSAITLQADGRILIAGLFTLFDGRPRNFLARLYSNGSLDTSFDAGLGPQENNYVASPISALAIQPDGDILVGGRFRRFNGLPLAHLVRLHADGGVDGSFTLTLGGRYPWYYPFLTRLVLQPDGNILIGGAFSSVNGTERAFIARLNGQGSLDTGFDPATVFTPTQTGNYDFLDWMILQPNGQIILPALLLNYPSWVARLKGDGSLDPDYFGGQGPNSGLVPQVFAVGLQKDGRAIIGGSFENLNALPFPFLARLNAGR